MNMILSGLKKHVRHNAAPVIWALRDYRMARRFDDGYWAKARENLIRTAIDLTTVPLESLLPEKYDDLDLVRDHVLLEINNTCNIDCLMCKTSLSTRKKGKMADGVLTEVLDRLAKAGVQSVALHTIGDPLANPRLDKVLGELRKRRITTAISTNGLLLERHVDTLLHYADICSAVRFSIDGATRETYEKIRSGGNWDELLRNLAIARDKLVTRGIVINVAIVLSDDNFHEVGQYITLFRDYVRYPYAELNFSLINALSPDNTYFHAVNPFPNHTHKYFMCPQAAGNRLTVLVNGDTTVCCRDYNGDMITGNLLRQSAQEIIDSPELLALRQAHERRDLSAYPMCNSCFVSDDRVARLVNGVTRYMIAKHPNEEAAFYQERIDQLRTLLAGSGPYDAGVAALLH